MSTPNYIGKLGILFRCSGSVFPKAALFSFPCGLFSAALKAFDQGVLGEYDPIGIAGMKLLNSRSAYTVFITALGFLFVFRTSQAYERFWEGFTAGHRMMAEWWDAAATMLAFSKCSTGTPEDTLSFEHRFVRLVSLLHANAVAELRDLDGKSFNIIDINGLDKESVMKLAESPAPVALTFQWLMQLMTENLSNGVISIPPPISTRVFQEMANGMVEYHEALKIMTTDFPFPYHQMTTLLLLLHYGITPIVMCMWVDWPHWAFVFTVVQVFVFWALYFTSMEIEFPFREGKSNYDAKHLHNEFNGQLLLLIHPSARRTPKLSSKAVLDFEELNKINHHKYEEYLGLEITKMEKVYEGAGAAVTPDAQQ
jgi:predicted membrane chloride channel (bestrophin family)